MSGLDWIAGVLESVFSSQVEESSHLPCVGGIISENMVWMRAALATRMLDCKSDHCLDFLDTKVR